MNKYVDTLGVGQDWQFTDVFGLDDDLLCMVPQPCGAVLLLYPLTEKAKGTDIGEVKANDNIYFMKQTIGNACGTIGLIHALLNNTDNITLKEDKHLYKFYQKTLSMNSSERAETLEKDTEFGAAHEGIAQEGQTQAPDLSSEVKGHFIAFIHKDGGLYELDGRRDNPVYHGATTPETLLKDAATTIKKFMARDPEELLFTLTAFSKI